MSSNDMFAHRDQRVATAMGRIAGIVRRYDTVVNTAKDPAAVFIRRRMYRRSDIGRTSQEQRQVIETALCIMQERGLIVTPEPGLAAARTGWWGGGPGAKAGQGHAPASAQAAAVTAAAWATIWRSRPTARGSRNRPLG